MLVFIHFDFLAYNRGLHNLFRALFKTVWPWLGLFALYFQIFITTAERTIEVPNTVQHIGMVGQRLRKIDKTVSNKIT